MAIQHDDDAPVEVQLTPLIDCVFLLLIFFLVSSQLKKVEKRLEIELPEAHVAKSYKQTPDIISVGVNASGKLFVNARAVGAGGLLAALREAKAAAPGRRVVLDGDMHAPFRAVVQALDACAMEGLEVAGIHTAEDVPRQ
jgi:biopolymer transport protein ExbD